MGRVQTTQVTGKGWKGLQALGCLGSIIGLTMFITAVVTVEHRAGRAADVGRAADWGMGLLMIGLPAYILSRVGAWWYHG